MDVIRQGDVAFIPAKTIEGEKQKSGNHGHTLVEGEATFHHHILEKGEFYKIPETEEGVVGVIDIPAEGTNLIHLNVQTKELTKDHDTITFTPKKDNRWKVLRQFEYWPEGYKKIAD